MLQLTDHLAFQNATKLGKATVADILALATSTSIIDNLLSTSGTFALSANMGRELNEKIDALGTAEHTAADTTALIALTDIVAGDKVFVDDASGDGTVTIGWAIYRATVDNPTAIDNATGYRKIAEGESLDVVMAPTNLAYVAAANQGEITNTNGSGFIIPAVSALDAGLMQPSHRSKLGQITVTAPIDLDQIKTDVSNLQTKSHDAVTLAGAATNNPLTLAGQEVGFSILQLQDM